MAYRNFILLFLILLPLVTVAQKRPRRITGGHKMSQWFIGIRSGINFTGVQPAQYHSEFSNSTQTEGSVQESKVYNKQSSNVGTQIGLSTIFAPNPHFYISFRPVYSHINYSYSNELNWIDEDNANNSLKLKYDHKQSLSYIEMPLLLRYNLSTKKVKPYIQAGGFYGRLIEASKAVTTTGIDKASGGVNEFSNGTQATGVTDLYLKSQVGLLGGAGIGYNLGGIMVSLDANLKVGMNNIVNVKERYSATRQLEGFGNVLDDTKLKNLEISFSLLFPLKFLTKTFEPIIL